MADYIVPADAQSALDTDPDAKQRFEKLPAFRKLDYL